MNSLNNGKHFSFFKKTHFNGCNPIKIGLNIIYFLLFAN